MSNSNAILDHDFSPPYDVTSALPESWQAPALPSTVPYGWITGTVANGTSVLRVAVFPADLRAEIGTANTTTSESLDTFKLSFNRSLLQRSRTEVASITVGNPVEFDLVLETAIRNLRARLSGDIVEALEDARNSEAILPRPLMIDEVMKLIDFLVSYLAMAPGLRCASFLESDGRVGLVFRSVCTNRRVTCRLDENTHQMTVHSIDQGMKSTHMQLLTTDKRGLQELVEWVTRRS